MKLCGINIVASCFSGVGASTSSSIRTRESNTDIAQAAGQSASLPSRKEEEKPLLYQAHLALPTNSRVRWKIEAKFRNTHATATQNAAGNHVHESKDYLEVLNDSNFFAFNPRPSIFRPLSQNPASLAAIIKADIDEVNRQRLSARVQAGKKALREQLEQVQRELEARPELTPLAINARMVKLTKAVSAACKVHDLSLAAPSLALLRTIGSIRIQDQRIPLAGYSNEALACAKSIDQELKQMQAESIRLQTVTEITEEDELFDVASLFPDVASDIIHSPTPSFHSMEFNDDSINNATPIALNEEDSSISRQPNEKETQETSTRVLHRHPWKTAGMFAATLKNMVRTRKSKNISDVLRVAVEDNNVDGIREFASEHLQQIPEKERLAWLYDVAADKAMRKTVAKASPEAIAAWGDVIQLLPKGARFAFLGKRDEKNNLDSIACSIFKNTELDAMKAWGDLLELIPNLNQERSKLLFARMDHEEGRPALATLLERGGKKALNQFVELVDKHMHLGNEEIHHVLLDCMSALKILTSMRGRVSGREAQDWVRANGLKYANPISLFGIAEETAKAYGKLVKLVPKRYRNDVLFPEDIWMVTKKDDKEGCRSALCQELDPHQARELAHSITLLKAMVPGMRAEERKAVLNEIRSRHATKKMGIWTNTRSYEKFKKEWPVVDAMLLDLKAALKEDKRS